MGDLYKHIERLGREHGFKNMTALCKAAGVPRTTMSELNSGRSKDLSKPNAQKFANVLGMSLGEIYGEETKAPPTSDGEREITDRDIKAAFFRGVDMTDEEMEDAWKDAQEYAKFKIEQRRRRNDR